MKLLLLAALIVSPPSPERPKAPHWTTRCARELQRARVNAAKKDRVFAKGKVEILSDEVEFVLDLGAGELYSADVRPDGGTRASNGAWSKPIPIHELNEEGWEGVEQVRAADGLEADLLSSPGRRATFIAAFMPALDRCLARGQNDQH